MGVFLAWFARELPIDPLLKAAIAHLWFITVHPFDDGNGRIARAITDLALARSEGTPQRFYSMSAQIRVECDGYFRQLESTQKGGLDITDWLQWFFECLGNAFARADGILVAVLEKAQFWERHAGESINDRQRLVLRRLLAGLDGKLTSSRWAKIAKCSQDTALRDIDDLLARRMLIKDAAGGRSTSYSLAR